MILGIAKSALVEFASWVLRMLYNMVDWGFLQYMMTRMGFGMKWSIGSIIVFLQLTFHFSILVNGSPKGYFKSSRGIRQGDPLSSMLFVIVVEAWNALLDKAKHWRLIFGFTIDNA